MEANQIAAVLLPSKAVSPDDPGHMTIRFCIPSGSVEHRGFQFLLEDLPEEYRRPSQYRRYLFDHRVEGYVVDDLNFAQRLAKHADALTCRSWTIQHPEAVKPLYPSATRREGWYSFNPDDFEECHNCVTWAVDRINEAAGADTLERPPNGRVKLMLAILSQRDSSETKDQTS